MILYAIKILTVREFYQEKIMSKPTKKRELKVQYSKMINISNSVLGSGGLQNLNTEGRNVLS
jgi:hypothetical protein